MGASLDFVLRPRLVVRPLSPSARHGPPRLRRPPLPNRRLTAKLQVHCGRGPAAELGDERPIGARLGDGFEVGKVAAYGASDACDRDPRSSYGCSRLEHEPQEVGRRYASCFLWSGEDRGGDQDEEAVTSSLATIWAAFAPSS